MVKNKIDIELLLQDKATRELKRFDNQVKTSTKSMGQQFAVLAAKVAAVTIAVKGISSALSTAVSNASKVEQVNIRLQQLLGTAEAGNRVFEDMRRIAGRVTQSFEEITEASAALAGVVKGGADEINQLMPIILDISASTGIGVQEVTAQIIRMYSAGAGAADLFRERGVLAALGLQDGVKRSGRETVDFIIQQWQDGTSKFAGANDKLADSWDGTTSQLRDSWFTFTSAIGKTITESEAVKGFIRGLTSGLNALAEATERARTGDAFGGKELEQIQAQIAISRSAVRNIQDRIESQEVLNALVKDEIALLYEQGAAREAIYGTINTRIQEINDLMLRNPELRNNEILLEQLEQLQELRTAIFEKQIEEFDVLDQRQQESAQNQASAIEEAAQIVAQSHEEQRAHIERNAAIIEQRMTSAFTRPISAMIQGSKSAKEAIKDIGKGLLQIIADYVAELVVSMTIGQALSKIAEKLAIAQARVLQAAWTGPAYLASVATLGGAAAVGGKALFSGAILTGGALQALSQTNVASAQSSGDIPGLAEGGIVPATPGGRIVRVAEGGEDELVTPLSKIGGGITINLYEPRVSNDVDVVDFAERLGFELEDRLRSA